MKLPIELENLVLDYYWSLRLWEQKQCCHREIRHLWLLQEVKCFYNCFYSLHPPVTDYYDALIQTLL
jgi:hypothetical protein